MTQSTMTMGRISRRERRPFVSNGVLGMSLFVATEMMFFAALVSSFLVIRSSLGSWAPPEDVTLPIAATAFNTFVLFISGLAMALAGMNRFESRRNFFFQLSVFLGAFFVCFQGVEWVGLLKHGMTMQSGVFGATFFLLIGSHGLHAAAAVLGMAWFAILHRKGQLPDNILRTSQVFWFFVVSVWPVLYGLVYF